MDYNFGKILRTLLYHFHFKRNVIRELEKLVMELKVQVRHFNRVLY